MDKEKGLLQKEKLNGFINDKQYVAMKPSEIAMFMEVPIHDIDSFNEIVSELVKEGRAVITKRGKIMPPDKLNLLYGSFISNAKGFGFVSSDKLEGDVFISESNINGAMHKDKVLFRVIVTPSRGKRKEGEIVSILERGINLIVGEYEEMKGFGFVVPDERKLCKDIFIPLGSSKGAVTGHKVAVKITKPPTNDRNPEGEVINILGHKNDPGVDVLSVLIQHEIPMEFSEDVYKQVEKIPDVVLEKELEGRVDLRNVVMVTIDGADAMDLDDAVSIEKLSDNQYRLGVHIADVSHYVNENSPLYNEAYNRGTSVYLVDRVIPMLPHKLSNNICSLNPHVDRLALSCIMVIDSNGSVISHEICETVINTNERMTYDDVNEILKDENSPLQKSYKELVPMFKIMEELSAILRNKRIARGAIEFGFAECKIILDEKGIPIDILPYYRNEATSIIEEFMLICNETVAENYFWLDLPFVYRTHEEPDSLKMEKLAEFVQRLGYSFRAGKGYTKSIQKLLSSVDNSPEELIINKVVLRSMKQARYTPANIGHFGLAAKYYCHFTSPIRRFPDLQIHRIIKDNLNGRLESAKIDVLEKTLSEICNHCCITERTAEEAERETDNLKKVQYMIDKVGQEFDGVISSVTSWGIYVELPNTVEGMVATNDLDDDYYIFEEEYMHFRGERSGKIYRIGDKVRILVAKANMEIRKIDFIFVDAV